MLPSTPTFPLRPVAACIVALAASVPAARAAEPFAIIDIRVEGLQRTDPGTVFASLPFRNGDTYTDEKGAAALRALFATGLFKDVRIEIDGKVVIVIVEERSIIANVSFVGMKEFESEQLAKALKDSGIGEGLPFDRALVDRAEQEIKRQYLSRSLYGAEVTTTITPLERNRVNVVFTMNEGESAKIKEIRIVGNKAFSESTLLALMDQTRGGWLTWYTKTDRYSRTKLNADLETIRAHYTNRGYLEFEVESTQVTISPDKQDISITVSVREGQPYTVTAVRLEGEYLGRKADFERMVRIKPGDAYRSADVAATTKAFGDLYGLYGYAFARVEARPEIDHASGKVAVVLNADPQRRVYVRRINIAGNDRTRDEVIRREFRQLESAWYDGERIKLSKDRVQRLGYFKDDVNVETDEVPGSPDQVDLTIKVTEKPTGNLLVGAGYSNSDKLSFTTSIKQENVFGSGNYLGIELNTSRSNRNIVLSTVDPYWTIDGISRSIDLYYRTSKPVNSQGEQYELVTPGMSIRFGVPFSEFDTVFFGIGFEQTRIGGNVTNKSYRDYRELYGPNSSAVPLTIGWARDQRDSQLRVVGGRRCALPAHQPAVAALHPDRQQVHAGPERGSGHRQGPGRQAVSDLQELLRWWPRFRPHLRAEFARCGRRHQQLHRRQPQAQCQRRVLPARSGQRQRQEPAPLHLRGRRQRVGRERKDQGRQPACIGGYRPVMAGPGGPAAAVLGQPDPQAAQR
jgi:outer membrane protein insertion porin family